MKQILIPILDNGHGKDTADKRSPIWNDGSQLFEYEFNRDIVSRIARMLKEENIQYHILVPELIDISLNERCRRANRIHSDKAGKTFLVSVHANASNGDRKGKGWEVWTSVGRTKSDDIATKFFEQAEKDFPDRKMRKDMSDGDPDKESQFYILKHTTCPAILTENFFFDNEEECKWLMKSETREKIARMHVNAIKRVIY